MFYWSTDNEIKRKGIKALSEALRINTSLTYLDLDSDEELLRKWQKEWKWTNKHKNRQCDKERGSENTEWSIENKFSIGRPEYKRFTHWWIWRNDEWIMMRNQWTDNTTEDSADEAMIEVLKTNTTLTLLNLRWHIESWTNN